MLDQVFIKIDQKTQRKSFEAQIGNDLCRVNRQQLIHSFQLNQEFFFNDDIGAVAEPGSVEVSDLLEV